LPASERAAFAAHVEPAAAQLAFARSFSGTLVAAGD
jgi:hypothetical protein